MKKLFTPLIGLLVVLAACAPAFDPKAQLQDDSTTVITQVQKEDAAVSSIATQLGAFPSAFEQAYADDANQDFQNNGEIAKLIAKRKTAYTQLESAQAKLEDATNRLIKLNSRNDDRLPKTALKKTLTSLRLAKLDHKTFDNYYKELLSAESDFFDTVAADPSDQAGIESALTQLNQYDSSLSQQAEIVSANLQSVTADATALHHAAKAMQ